MKQKTSSNANKNKQSTSNVILIDDDFENHEFQFQNLNEHRHAEHQQQQQVMNNQRLKQSPQGHFIIDVREHASPPISESQLQKQFQQIRFGSAQCNLMDMDIQNYQAKKSVLELSPYEYQQFIHNRVIEIQTPQLITEGYIMSYKLYQIKTRVIDSKEEEKQQKSNQFPQFDSGLEVEKKKNLNKNQQQKQQKLSSKEYDTCVSRRFSDFQYLNELLVSNYGGFIIPLLPQKNFWTIVNLQGKEYAQHRTKSLVKFLSRLFTHKKLKHSEQLKNFLFQQDSKFSTQKGQFLQKNKRLQDKIISIGSGAYQYGRALYNKFLGGSGEKGRNQEQIRLSKNKLTKDDLVLSQYQIIVAQLMRIMSDMKLLVQNTIQEIQTVQDINSLFSSGLTDSFNIPTQKPDPVQVQQKTNEKKSLMNFNTFQTNDLSQEFQQISQFISSCHAAIQRRKALRQQIQSLKQQQQAFNQKYKNSPRSLQLDIIRSKLNKLNKMNQTYAQELIKQLQSHIDEGKGMLRIFVVKFQKIKNSFFSIQFT